MGSGCRETVCADEGGQRTSVRISGVKTHMGASQLYGKWRTRNPWEKTTGEFETRSTVKHWLAAAVTGEVKGRRTRVSAPTRVYGSWPCGTQFLAGSITYVTFPDLLFPFNLEFQTCVSRSLLSPSSIHRKVRVPPQRGRLFTV